MGKSSSKANKKDSKKHKSHHKKHKKHKKRRHGSSSSSDSGSDSDSGGHARAGSALSQLERERAAVQGARYLLATQQAIRKSFRELLWELDNGRSVGLGGVPDELLRSQLQFILELLGLKCTKGQYWLPTGTSPTLSVIGFAFDEPPRAASAAPPGMPTPAQQQQQQEAEAQQQQEQEQQAEAEAADREEQQQQQERQQEGAAPAVVVGPAGPPPRPAAEAAHTDKAAAAAGEAAAHEAPEESAPKRRRVGPAAPSAELLAAAAAYHADIEAAGGYVDDTAAAAAEGPGPGPEQDVLVGPPPPEFVDEDNAAPADAREAAVVRVMRVLRDAAANAPAGPVGPQAAPAAEVVADPYAVLGVEAAADTGAVRKAYWRLSLLVHPDKCSHPSAHEAFQAVSKAAKLLQDAEARKIHDAAAEDAAMRKAAVAAAAAAERQAAWATARGEAVPPEVAAQLAAARAAAAGPATRESWMTDLPPEKRPPSASDPLAGLTQVSQTSFSRFGTRTRGDTSGWTDTPEVAAKRAAGLLTDTPGAGLLTFAGAGAVPGEGAPVSATLKAAMEQYGQNRQKSLLEMHAERQAAGGGSSKGRGGGGSSSSKGGEKQKGEKGGKDKKSDKKSDKKDKKKDGKNKTQPAAGGGKEEWAGAHPWKPWDRDKDMNVPASKPKGAADLLKMAGSLASRFGK